MMVGYDVCVLRYVGQHSWFVYCNGRAPRPALIAQLGERKTEGYVQNILRTHARFTVKVLPWDIFLIRTISLRTWRSKLAEMCERYSYYITMKKIPFVMVRDIIDTIVRTITDGSIVDTWEYLLHNTMEIYWNVPVVLYFSHTQGVMRWISRY